MPAPSYSALDFRRALQALLPRGRAWPRDEDAVQTKGMGAFSGVFARHHARANQLLVDAFPSTTDELLPEWEASLGLPDPCAGSQPTLQQRRNQVVARLINGGGQSVGYFVSFAQTLGFTITVTEFSPFRVGASRVGAPLYGSAWAHAWQVNAALNTIVSFRASMSAVAEPLRSWGNAVLECELRPKVPAHSTVIFAYS